MKISKEVGGVLLAVIGIFMFSAKAVLVKIAYRYDIDPVSLLLMRMIFAMPVYLSIAAIKLKKPTPGRVERKDYLKILFLGFVGYYLASFFDFVGLQYISASLERLILFAYPTIVVVLSAVFFSKKIGHNQWIAISVTYLGIALTFIPDLAYRSDDNLALGSVLIFLSAFTYAMYIVGSGNLIPKFGSVYFTSLAMSISCICVIAHHFIIHGTYFHSYPAEVYVLGLAMAFFCTVIPSFLISEAIKRIGSSNFAVIGSLGPISTITLAVIFINEKVTIYHLLGTAIVIAGIFMLRLKKAA